MPVIFKNIRKNLLTSHKLGNYLIYAIGEIVLVVVGILIALQINNCNRKQLESYEESEIYRNIRLQVLEDKEELVEVMAFNSYYKEVYQYANKIIRERIYSKQDSLALFAMSLSQYSDFHRSGTLYENLVNSGELGLLKNDSITRALQRLETTYIFINQLEEMHWEIIISELSDELKGVINYSTQEVLVPEKLYGVELQNIFFEVIGISELKDAIYQQAIDEMDDIVHLIDMTVL